jgi:glycosyltransferase involved in cell wall biosynthesis
VIAYPEGSVPEILEEGVSGLIVHDIEEAAQATGRVARLDRARVRACFEARFTVQRMAQSYVDLFEAMTAPQGRVPAGIAA